VFVLSACPFRAPEIAETRTVLEGFGLPIAPVAITDRRAFARAVATGRAVTEFESKGKAAEEIRELWNWLKRELTHDVVQDDRSRRIHPQAGERPAA
jgi:chromosome partitioning protein